MNLLAVENQRLGDRLFAETVVFTVEWHHLVFAVCVQKLHLQLVVTETYTGNIVWQEDYWHSTRYRLAQTQCDNSDCNTVYVSHHQTSHSNQLHQLCCVYWSAMLTVQYTFTLPSNIQHTECYQLCCVYWTAMLTVQYTFTLPSNIQHTECYQLCCVYWTAMLKVQ